MGLKVFTRKIVAQNKSEMTQKPIDTYTISHILMGIVSYLLFFLILEPFNIIDRKYISLISVLFWAIIWEYVENFILLKTRFKVGNKKDSLENSLTDIVFTGIGGFIPFFEPLAGIIVMISLIVMNVYYRVKKSAMG